MNISVPEPKNLPDIFEVSTGPGKTVILCKTQGLVRQVCMGAVLALYAAGLDCSSDKRRSMYLNIVAPAVLSMKISHCKVFQSILSERQRKREREKNLTLSCV